MRRLHGNIECGGMAIQASEVHGWSASRGQPAGPISVTPTNRSLDWLLGVIASLVSSACTTVGPDFNRPAVPWLAAWSGGSLQTSGAVAGQRPQSEEWWTNFNDPVLDGLIAEAQRLNPEVRTA